MNSLISTRATIKLGRKVDDGTEVRFIHHRAPVYRNQEVVITDMTEDFQGFAEECNYNDSSKPNPKESCIIEGLCCHCGQPHIVNIIGMCPDCSPVYEKWLNGCLPLSEWIDWHQPLIASGEWDMGRVLLEYNEIPQPHAPQSFEESIREPIEEDSIEAFDPEEMEMAGCED